MIDFFKSFIYAIRGVFVSFEGQRNLKVQAGVAVLTMAAGFYCDITTTEWCLVFLAIGLVLALELINTAIEELVNLVMPHIHPQAGKVKDIAAGAVLVASVMAVVVGVLIFRKYLL